MSWIAAAVIGGSALTTGGSIYAASEQSSAVGAATDAQQISNFLSLMFQGKVRKQNLDAIKEAVEKGLISIDEGYTQAQELLTPMIGLEPIEQMQELLTLGPGEMTSQQEREYQRGIEAAQGAYSRVSGGGVSSRALENLQMFGKDYEAQRLNDQLNRLMPLINIVLGTRTNLANLETGKGTQEANLMLGGASALAGVPSQGIAEGLQNIGTIEASGIISDQNVQTQLLNNLFGLGSNLTNLAIERPELFSGGKIKTAPDDYQRVRNVGGVTQLGI